METQIENPVEKVIRLAKGQTPLAKGLGITPQAVQQWVVEGQIPPGRCKAIEKFLGGRMTRAEMRPDVFGD